MSRDPMPPPGRPDHPWLQVLRAVAALSVVLFHVSFHLFRLEGHEAFFAAFGWRFGRFGVLLFFVISGALMARILEREADSATFLLRRLVRIYPAYLLAVAATLALHAAGGAAPAMDLPTLALIPGSPRHYVLGVEWTLPFELTFYLVLWLLLSAGLRTRLVPFALVWLACIAAANALWPGMRSDWQFPSILQLPFTEFSGGFAAGLLVPWLCRWKPPAWASLSAAVLLIACSEIGGLPPLWPVVAGSACLVAAAMTAPPGYRAPPPLLVTWGDRSYGLYLCHVPVALWAIGAAPAGFGPPAKWCLAMACVLASGALLGRVDIALHGRCRQWLSRLGAPARHRAVAGYLVVLLCGVAAQVMASGGWRP